MDARCGRAGQVVGSGKGICETYPADERRRAAAEPGARRPATLSGVRRSPALWIPLALGVAAWIAVVQQGGVGHPAARDGGVAQPGAAAVAWADLVAGGPAVVAIDDPSGSLRRALSPGDGRIAEIAGDLRWVDDPSTAAAGLGIATAPHLLFVGRSTDGAAVVLDACEPVGAARPGPAAVLRALRRFAETEAPGRLADLRARAAGDPGDAEAALDLVTALEAAGDLRGAEEALAGALARERSTVGPVHRFAEWRALLREGEGLADDPRATLRAALKKEASKRVLYRGWGLIATIQADRLERAEGDDERRKARTWLLEATREAYQRCPDRDLVPMLEVIVERFADDPDAVDVMDRYFLRGRVNQLARIAPDSPWIEVGRKLIEPR